MPKKTDEIEVTDRDFVMARMAAARAALQASIDAVDEFLTFCIEPDTDKRGKVRKEALEGALETVGVATRALECAQENIGTMDMLEAEPWEGDEDEEDDDDDDDDEDDDKED